MSATESSPMLTEPGSKVNRRSSRPWRLVGLVVAGGFLLGAALALFFERPLQTGSHSVADLIKATQKQDTKWDSSRQAVWRKLPRLFCDNFPGLQPIPAVFIRQQACTELALLGPSAARATPVLTLALDDPQLDVQLEAIHTLGAIGKPAEAAKSRLLAKLGQLRSQKNEAPFEARHFQIGLPSFVQRLKQPDKPWLQFISAQLSANTRQTLLDYQESITPSEALAANLAQDFNHMVGGPLIYESQRFAGVHWRAVTQDLLGRISPITNISRLNRLILEDALGMASENRFYILKSSERLYVEDVPAVGGKASWSGNSIMIARYWPLREALATALAAIAPNDPAVMAALFEEYDAQDNEEAPRAVYALIQQSHQPLEVFEKAIPFTSPSNKRDFVQALALAPVPADQKAAWLKLLAERPDPDIQFAAVGMLGKLGNAASVAVPTLTNLYSATRKGKYSEQTDPLLQRIIFTLGAIGPGAQAAIPLLESEYRNKANPRRIDAALARWRIDGHCADTLPVVAEGLRDPLMEKREQTLQWLTEISHRNKEGIPFLMEGLEDPADLIRVQTIAALVSFGTNAAVALPALEAASTQGKAFVSMPAKRAIDIIRPHTSP